MTPIESTVAELVRGWTAHFYSADRELQWLAAEQEMSLWLGPATLLLGKVDAIGRDTKRELFFGEWKTANPREKATWKQVWRMNPQSLTYGVLAEARYPGCRRFTVRKAFKSAPPSYDHAWFEYSEGELEWWRGELLRVAAEIRSYRAGGARPWPTNVGACFRYGPKNACPFFEPACSQLKWGALPGNGAMRISHLAAERRLNEAGAAAVNPDLVVLDATRVKAWLDCRERYHNEYELGGAGIAVPAGEALLIGTGFHESIDVYYQSMIRGMENER